DLGGSGPLVVPGVSSAPPAWAGPGAAGESTTIAIGGGKAGVLYAIDTGRITGANQIEGTPLAPPDQQYKLGAIDECIDFDTDPRTVNPPDGSGVTLPRLWPYPPVAVPTASHAGTDGRPMPPAALRPLCAPVNIVPGQGSNYGVKSDGEMHHVMGGPVFW